MWSGSGWRAEAIGAAPHDDPPPLRVWAFTAFALIAFLSASLVSFARQDETFVAFNAARLHAYAQRARGPGTYAVIALGDSRLKYATLDEAELARRADHHGLSDLRVLRIVDNLATYGSFAALEEAILAARPDLLLIQVDLLLREQTMRGDYSTTQRYLSRWMRYILRRGSPEHDQQSAAVRTGCAERETREETWARMTVFASWIRVDPSPRTRERALELVHRARRAGTAVALVEVRSSPELEAYYRGSDLDSREALARLRRASDLPLWSFPSTLAVDENFCDYTHLSEPARARYSEWLIARIASAARSQ